ncbi:MAG: hypothetical protein HY332_20390 [Chloroflexi bacterium]|nr:hypothetical protein [Chloroflexota bacterium]
MTRRADRAHVATAWHRIEKRDEQGQVIEWCEVGPCASCGRGVDREFPVKYKVVADTLLCSDCAPSSRAEARPAGAKPEPGN